MIAVTNVASMQENMKEQLIVELGSRRKEEP